MWYRITRKSTSKLHMQQIKDRGFTVIYRKLKKLHCRIFTYILILAAIPAVLVIRLIRPFICIRFGSFIYARIGHFSADAGILLAERNLRRSAFRDWYWLPRRTCNDQLARMIKRAFYVRWWVRYLNSANHHIPGGKAHVTIIPLNSQGSRDIHGSLNKTKDIPAAYLAFSSVEESEAERFINGLGFRPGERFVCFIVRDSAYLNTFRPEGEWSYHNYRDSDITTYEEAAISLAERGYWVFRMGKTVENPMSCEHPHIIDYACHEMRCDLLDIWLMANTHFCVSTGTGLDEVSVMFRRPVVNVNLLPVCDFVSWGNHISTPKHLMWKHTGKELSLKQHLEYNYMDGRKLQASGIDVVDLTPGEISDAVLEMEKRLSGVWVDTPEDTEMQQEFWRVFRDWKDFSKLHGFIHPDARIGAHFLRNYPDFLKK